MAENQGVLGDQWNDYANRLLKLLGWEHIGDKDMDITGSGGETYGIDAIACYESPGLAVKQCCLVESKRYAMSSINASVIKKWIERLKQKLDGVYQSKELRTEFPQLRECCPINLGVIMCWVHDATNERYFEDEFEKYLNSTRIVTMPKPMAFKRIIVLSNLRILRLCSIASVLKDNTYKYEFYYPSQLINNKPFEMSKVLTIDYALSDIIMAERKKGAKSEKVVFYFGAMNLEAINTLKDALTMYNMMEAKKSLIIYHYEGDASTREIMPDAKKLFGKVKVVFISMDHFDLTTEPAIIKNEF
jgi:hypothetical protein